MPALPLRLTPQDRYFFVLALTAMVAPPTLVSLHCGWLDSARQKARLHDKPAQQVSAYSSSGRGGTTVRHCFSAMRPGTHASVSRTLLKTRHFWSVRPYYEPPRHTGTRGNQRKV